MGINIEGLGTVDPERWERTDPDDPDYLTVAEGDSRFQVYIDHDCAASVSIDMSYGRSSWLRDYLESIGASKLLHRNRVERDPDDHLAGGHVHSIDALAVADALDAEIQAGRHRAYCDNHPSRTDPTTGDFTIEDITYWRDFLRVCGGYYTW